MVTKEGNKQCPKCQKWKLAVMCFYKVARVVGDGYAGYCKECTKKKVIEWQGNNPEKKAASDKKIKAKMTPEQKLRQKEAVQRWDQQNREKRSGYVKKYRTNNVDKVLAREARYRRNNKEKIQAMQRKYHQKPEIKEANRLRMLEYRKTPEYRIYNRARQERRYTDSKNLSSEQWIALIDEFNSCCAYCGQKHRAAQLHMDHIHPFSLGGRLEPGNVVPSCKGCNSMKQDKTLEEFHKYPGSPQFDISEVMQMARSICDGNNQKPNPHISES